MVSKAGMNVLSKCCSAAAAPRIKGTFVKKNEWAFPFLRVSLVIHKWVSAFCGVLLGVK